MFVRSRILLPAIVALALAGFATAASATPITYDLTLTAALPLDPSGTGYFTIDGPVNPSAIQTFSPSTGTLLALEFDIDGHVFNLVNATGAAPSIYFVLGALSSIGYQGGSADVGITTFGTSFTYYDFYAGYPGTTSNGRISYALVPPPPPSGTGDVPEPLTLSLVGAGLAGIGATRKRRSAA